MASSLVEPGARSLMICLGRCGSARSLRVIVMTWPATTRGGPVSPSATIKLCCCVARRAGPGRRPAGNRPMSGATDLAWPTELAWPEYQQ